MKLFIAAVVALAVAASAAPAPAPAGLTVGQLLTAVCKPIVGEITSGYGVLYAALGTLNNTVIPAPPKGTVVVLAPTDAAFGTLLTNAGLTPEAALANQALIADFILYHVGVATSERATSIKNLAGDTIKLSLNLAAAEDGTIVTGPANKPKVTGEPIQCTAENQWMLPMDAVLLPAKYAALAKPAAPTAAPTAKAPAAPTAGPTVAPMAKAPAATTTSPAMAPSPASSAQTAVLGAAAALAVFVALA